MSKKAVEMLIEDRYGDTIHIELDPMGAIEGATFITTVCGSPVAVEYKDLVALRDMLSARIDEISSRPITAKQVVELLRNTVEAEVSVVYNIEGAIDVYVESEFFFGFAGGDDVASWGPIMSEVNRVAYLYGRKAQ